MSLILLTILSERIFGWFDVWRCSGAIKECVWVKWKELKGENVLRRCIRQIGGEVV